MSIPNRIWLALLLLCLIGVAVAAVYAMRREQAYGLHEALTYGMLEEARAIIEDGVDVDYRVEDETPLLVAAREGHGDILVLLLEAGADPNVPGAETPLLVAALGGHGEIVDLLLEAGADPNAIVWGGTPLLDNVAAGAPSETFFRFFGEDRKLNPDILVRGETILCWRLLGGGNSLDANSRDVIRYIVSEGADVNIVGVTLESPPINLAVRSWDLEMVQILCEAGADVNVTDVTGRYPLHSAVYEGLNMVNLLMEHGAELNVVDRSGLTPLDLARILLDAEFDAEMQEVVNYLESLSQGIKKLESLNTTH